jgi:hypothetical protein
MKRKSNFRGLCTLLLSGSLFFAISCDGDTPTTATTTEDTPPVEQITSELAVAPPITGLDVPFVDYQVNVKEGARLTTTTGSVIEIPADAFVDKNGQPLKGEVTIQFREFHDATDIVASGIPMHNPDDGSYMETAGMFEIKGKQDGKEIFVKEDKDINVNLASFNDGDEFNFYALGPKDCRWEDLGTAEATPNTEKKNKLKLVESKIAAAKGKKPRCRKDVKNYVFELEVNYGRFAELKAYKDIIWEYAGIGPDPEKSSWVFESNWDDVKLEQRSDGFYNLKLIPEEGGKVFETTVRPILGDGDYKKALAQFNAAKGKEIAQIIKEQEERRAKLAQESDINRAFQINGFGIYNWDVWKNPNRIRFQPDILVDNDKESAKRNDYSYFLIASHGRSVIRYSGMTIDKFSFNPNEKNALIAVLNDGSVAVFSSEDFAAIDLAKVQNTKQKVPFNMTLTPMRIDNMADLDEVIQTAIAS